MLAVDAHRPSHVQIFHDGVYGTVCDGMDEASAVVACGQLGYTGGR